MTPQASFTIIAPIARERVGELRAFLTTMNREPGTADPENKLVPFGRFEDLHFARFVILNDQTTRDIRELYGVSRPEPPTYLGFVGDFDGEYDGFIQQLVKVASPGLRRIFAFCEGFPPDGDLAQWMKAHEQRPSALYCNWVGRTVRQTRQEERLRLALRAYIEQQPDLLDKPASAVHRILRDFVGAAGLQLPPETKTPAGWTVRQALDWIVLVLLIVTAPVTALPLLLLVLRIRSLEKSDRVFAPRPKPQCDAALSALEDRGVTNQFSAMGTLKPGLARAIAVRLALWIVNLTARTIFTRGRLARVHTIHFARWVFLDKGTRILFASNYDGSLESYMDDFINKVGFGLNVVFGNGVGYPRTEWLLLKGSKDEQLFKYFLRRHQLPTEVWYNAHSGFTAHDLERNSRIREGLERSVLTEAQAREWIALL
ncbi:MAG: hypothetical protein JO108_37010 [Acidobacteriaceae bacterium]|nr:hypothetical protein [Acidobacteriaceae bacterium]